MATTGGLSVANYGAPLPAQKPDDAQEVRRRRSWRRRPQASRRQPPASRPVPRDLVGLCFNCFAADHVAAVCRNPTRCFRCKEVGHTSALQKNRQAPSPSQGIRRLSVTCGRDFGQAGGLINVVFAAHRRSSAPARVAHPRPNATVLHLGRRPFDHPRPGVFNSGVLHRPVHVGGGFSFRRFLGTSTMSFLLGTLSTVPAVRSASSHYRHPCGTWNVVWKEPSSSVLRERDRLSRSTMRGVCIRPASRCTRISQRTSWSFSTAIHPKTASSAMALSGQTNSSCCCASGHV